MARSRIRWCVGLAVVAPLSLLSGCGMVPRSRLDDCARLSQSLQVDNARMRDLTLKLRTQNQDYAQRAVDDARQLKLLADENARMERSIAGYQDDRERLYSAFQEIKDQARQAAVDADDVISNR